MPTVVTHGLAGLGVGVLLAPGPRPWSYYALCLALGVLPDLDVVSFSLGIPYRSRWGHRGMSHSLVLAAGVAALVAVPAGVWLDLSIPWLAFTFFAALATHALLDALTDGGMGVALAAPLSDRRVFLPWRPIRVSPIGRAAFGRWGLAALASEVLWVWVPLGLLIGLSRLIRQALAAGLPGP